MRGRYKTLWLQFQSTSLGLKNHEDKLVNKILKGVSDMKRRLIQNKVIFV